MTPKDRDLLGRALPGGSTQPTSRVRPHPPGLSRGLPAECRAGRVVQTSLRVRRGTTRPQPWGPTSPRSPASRRPPLRPALGVPGPPLLSAQARHLLPSGLRPASRGELGGAKEEGREEPAPVLRNLRAEAVRTGRTGRVGGPRGRRHPGPLRSTLLGKASAAPGLAGGRAHPAEGATHQSETERPVRGRVLGLKTTPGHRKSPAFVSASTCS